MRNALCFSVQQARVGEKVRPQTLLSALILLTLAVIWIAPTAAAAPQSRTSFCETGIRTQPNEPQTNLSVDLAVNEIIGNAVTAYATLTESDGSAIVAAPVNFYIGNKNAVPEWIGHAITDCDGVAIIRFVREKAGPIDITAKFEGSNALEDNQLSASLELKRIATEESAMLPAESVGVVVSIIITVIVILSGAVLAAMWAIHQDKRDALLAK